MQWSIYASAGLNETTHNLMVHIMACHLFGTKPLSQSMLAYNWLNPTEKRTEMLIKIQHFGCWPLVNCSRSFTIDDSRTCCIWFGLYTGPSRSDRTAFQLFMRIVLYRAPYYAKRSTRVSLYVSNGEWSLLAILSRRWIPLQWRHSERDGVSNHQRFDCLLNRLFTCR